MKKAIITLLSLCAIGASAQNTLPGVGETNALVGICWKQVVSTTNSPHLVDGVPVVHVGHTHSNYWYDVTVANVFWASFDYLKAGATNTFTSMEVSNVVSRTRYYFSVPMEAVVNAEEELEVE